MEEKKVKNKAVGTTFSGVPIGRLIREKLSASGHTEEWLSREAACRPGCLRRVFHTDRIGTETLLRVSYALDTDFFRYYSSNLGI